MSWYCADCGFPNGSNDVYCCHCHRIKNSFAFKDERPPSIAPSNGPLSPVAFSYNTHDDDNHEHYKAFPSNRLDLDLATIDATSAAPQNSREGKKRKFWYCCIAATALMVSVTFPPATASMFNVQRCEVVMLKM